MRTSFFSLALLATLTLAAGAQAQALDGWDGYGYDTGNDDPTRPRAWGRVEYLMWFSHGRNVPALASIDAGNAPLNQAGVLPPVGNAQVAFGNERVGEWIRNGGRITLGAAIDNDRIWSVEGRYFQLEQSQENGHISVDNNSVLARPFFRTDPDPMLTREDALLLTYPGITRDGRLDIKDASDYLSADIYTRAILWDDGANRFDGLVGYQYSRIDNSLEIRSSQVVTNSPPLAPPPTIIGVSDLFDTQNRFNGAQFGAAWTCYTDRLSLELVGRLGVGNMHEKLFIGGTTSLTPEGTTNTVTTPGGFLASLNSGTFTRNRLVIAPEFDANLVYHFTDRINFTVGYTFIYWNRVAMAGNNVDRTINLQRLSGVPVGEERPAAFFRETDFWVMGLNLGTEFKF
jgi:hypothetical protein